MPENLPWFKFNPLQILDDECVKAMSNEAFGIYIKMICHCWTQDSMPVDHVRMAAIFGVSKHKFKVIWPQVKEKFFEDNERFFNDLIFAQKKSLEKDFQQNSENGKKGANIRWGGHKKANSPPNGQTMQDIDKDIDKDKKKNIKKKNDDPLVQEIADYYKTNINSKLMTKGIKNLKSLHEKSKTPYQELFQRVKNYKAEIDRDGIEGFRYQMSNFFGRAAYHAEYLKVPEKGPQNTSQKGSGNARSNSGKDYSDDLRHDPSISSFLD